MAIFSHVPSRVDSKVITHKFGVSGHFESKSLRISTNIDFRLINVKISFADCTVGTPHTTDIEILSSKIGIL